METGQAASSHQGTQSWLRVEGAALFVLSLLLYLRCGTSWWWFAILWLAPDLSAFGYLAGPRRGAQFYNSIHVLIGPALAALAGIFFQIPLLTAIALIWTNHIGLDRCLGYGLKLPNGFQSTHLKTH